VCAQPLNAATKAASKARTIIRVILLVMSCFLEL
jgi:hypothetical protein